MHHWPDDELFWAVWFILHYTLCAVHHWPPYDLCTLFQILRGWGKWCCLSPLRILWVITNWHLARKGLQKCIPIWKLEKPKLVKHHKMWLLRVVKITYSAEDNDLLSGLIDPFIEYTIIPREIDSYVNYMQLGTNCLKAVFFKELWFFYLRSQI